VTRLSDNGALPAALDQCAAEPIHIIGHIQRHGLLFALTEPDLVVRQVSTNIHALIGLRPEDVLSRPFENVIGRLQFETFRTLVQNNDLLAPDPIGMFVGNKAHRMNCVVHRQDGVLIVELELRRGAQSLEPLNVAVHLRIPLLRMEQAPTITRLAQAAATEIRALSGFERAMIYRFDEAWNGEVIAEAVGSSAAVTYLGQHFPASDIPAQARRLFLLNHLRTIANVDSAPVPIVPEIGPLTGRPLDLTRSTLRSASPIHIEYLKNMGVASSMTVSIVVERRLWGMIACHDPEPHRVDSVTRSVCELIGEMLASQIALRTDNAALEQRLSSHKLLEKCMADLEAAKSLADAAFARVRLLNLFDADGLIARIDDVVTSQGAVVEEQVLLPAIKKLREIASRGIATTNMLSALEPSADAYASKISGALYISLSDWNGDYLLLVRRELIETITWAGNPEKAVSSDAGGGLRPRTSFAAWKETVRLRSRPWTELELENAHVLRELEERVRYLAHYDALTGLFNRDSINLKLEQCVNDAVTDGSSFSVVFIDLDGFRKCNDRLGHAAGDQVLKTVAARMQKFAQSPNLVGRLGNDEFVLILPVLTETEAFADAGRMLREINEPLGLEGDAEERISASLGVSRYPADGTSAELLVGRAYLAMSRIKQNGGNGLQAVGRS
jgi:chemotaxis family two-component system sensor kinase Cph1